MSALRLESVPADCWDWLTPADVVQHALAAYYAACREVQSSEGPWFDVESRMPWASREDFRDQVTGLFRQRINVQGHGLGITRSSGVVFPDLPGSLQWAGFEDQDPELLGCRGGTPAVMGHGCPAPSPAVGPAPTPSQRLDITAPASPLFAGQQVQELPEVNRPDNLTLDGELIA